MAKRLRTYVCIDCGEMCTRRRNYDQAWTCLECGVARATDAAYAMFTKNGPAWEAHQRNPGGRPKRSPPRE